MRGSLFVSLLAFIGLSVSHADELPPKFEKLPTEAEVHAVAVYEPHFRGVSEEEITDYQGLVKALRAKGGPGAHIRKQLPESANQVLTEEVEMGKLGDEVRPILVKVKVTRKLARAFSRAIEDKVFYDKDVFAKVELTKSLKELVALGDKRTVFQTERMNREILSLLFFDFLAETPTDYHTVHVTVKPDKPVVLVCSSYHQCRWKVKVEKGATVAGVVLFGNYAQELTGTDAPVVYRAGRLPNGKRGPTSGFNAYKETDDPSYKRIKEEVKEITGKEFTTFQGLYQAGPAPFVVTPSAK